MRYRACRRNAGRRTWSILRWDALIGIAWYFDAASAPIAPFGQPQKDFLSWLASWIGLTVDRHWPDEKKRQLVRQAYKLYRLRGTPEGLRQHIRLYMDTEPYILEHFKL